MRAAVSSREFASLVQALDESIVGCPVDRYDLVFDILLLLDMDLVQQLLDLVVAYVDLRLDVVDVEPRRPLSPSLLRHPSLLFFK